MPEMRCLTGVSVLLLLFRLLSLIPCQDAYTIGADDIKCLTTVKNSLKDPRGLLADWRFGNSTPGFICNFRGIQCWHPDENRVLSIKLTGMGLEGRFPDGLQHCGSLTDFNLSANDLSGTIPADICNQIPYLVSLDLSNNVFTGSIPAGLSNCTYLIIIRLNDNWLSGKIPPQLTRLTRLRELNVSDNKLHGRIPDFRNITNPSSFQNNDGLCGPPLKTQCK